MLDRAKAAARAFAHSPSVTTGPAYEDMGEAFHALRRRAEPYTMTSVERMFALYQLVRHVVQSGVRGDVVECGVWRGGSSMMAAMALAATGDPRPLWLYDTFEGMTQPTARDRTWSGQAAAAELASVEREAGARNDWCYASLDDVKANMARTGYPEELLHFVVGPVEETIPGQAPERIALVRLDTDWYESTRHELEHLWDRLEPGGGLIIDDYGHWQGARQATDEFFASRGTPVLLHRVDYTGRVAVKP